MDNNALQEAISHLNQKTRREQQSRFASKLYSMLLGEEQQIGGWFVTCVAGGWIYAANGMAVFVPYDNTFYERPQND